MGTARTFFLPRGTQERRASRAHFADVLAGRAWPHLQAYVSTWVIEVVHPGLRIVHVQTAGIDHDFAGGVNFHVRAVHGPRRGTLEVDCFRIVTAAVTRAFELVLGRLPLGGAT